MSLSTEIVLPSFSDTDILELAGNSSEAIAEWTKSTAQDFGITVGPGPHDGFIKAVSRLSDGVVDLDPVEKLLIALGRAGVLTAHQRALLQLQYLR